jgi:hypothetical protein
MMLGVVSLQTENHNLNLRPRLAKLIAREIDPGVMTSDVTPQFTGISAENCGFTAGALLYPKKRG